MKKISYILFLTLLLVSCGNSKSQSNIENKSTETETKAPTFKALVLTERGGQHGNFTDAAIKWLDTFSEENNFEYTEVNNTEEINEEFLSQYAVVIQLDFPPYTWTDAAQSAFIKYIEEGRGGWVGLHHATLLGEFDGYPMWQWFSDFMGGIRFKNYIAETASGTVHVEDKEHPVMEGVSESFTITNDEWYTFDKSPRSNVHVLANVDENTYEPMSEIKMGDHPAVWTNKNMKARNVYFLMGHAGTLFYSADFVKMFSNAIVWTANK